MNKSGSSVAFSETKEIYAAPYNIFVFVLIGVYLASIYLTTFAESTLPFAVSILVLSAIYVVVRLTSQKDISRSFFVLMIFIVCFQNVILAIFVENLSELNVKTFSAYSYVMIGAMFSVSLWNSYVDGWLRSVQIETSITVALAVYIIGSIAVLGLNGAAGLASIRNLTSIFLLYLFGWSLIKSGITIVSIALVASIFGVVVFAFGIFERFIYPDFWTSLNIDVLWEKKGILSAHIFGFPANWISTETINGVPFRRMVSTFADPVNLGAFMFSFFIAAFILENRLMMVLAATGSFFVISKAALLGFLLFAVCYSFYRYKRSAFLLSATGAFIVGLAFLIYSLIYNPGSIVAHVTGAVSAFTLLPEAWLGRGVGSVGVISSLFNESDTGGIAESGIGLVIGQLGLPGLILYLLFFWVMFTKLLEVVNIRYRIAGLSLHLAIFSNLVFNEVALSPNSNLMYMILIGAICSASENEKRNKFGNNKNL